MRKLPEPQRLSQRQRDALAVRHGKIAAEWRRKLDFIKENHGLIVEGKLKAVRQKAGKRFNGLKAAGKGLDVAALGTSTGFLAAIASLHLEKIYPLMHFAFLASAGGITGGVATSAASRYLQSRPYRQAAGGLRKLKFNTPRRGRELNAEQKEENRAAIEGFKQSLQSFSKYHQDAADAYRAGGQLPKDPLRQTLLKPSEQPEGDAARLLRAAGNAATRPERLVRPAEAETRIEKAAVDEEKKEEGTPGEQAKERRIIAWLRRRYAGKGKQEGEEEQPTRRR
ncbi:hypothetical protein HY095_04215 [Candidatus Micrarchaeota archaeon]|nr:hypothetical protein [Candidatus Micrarchaeota archaeon]